LAKAGLLLTKHRVGNISHQCHLKIALLRLQ
jgi:hypothetical protein